MTHILKWPTYQDICLWQLKCPWRKKHVQIIVLTAKICKGNVCKVRVVCIRMHDCVCWKKERAYTCGVCNRALSCNDILNVLLHTSQVYVYVHLTNKKNLTSNPNLPMDCHPSITPILYFADIIHSMVIVCKLTNHKAVSTAAAAA